LSTNWASQGFDAYRGGDRPQPRTASRVEDNKFTTQAALNLELSTIRLMQQGRGQVEAIVPSSTLAESLLGCSLTDEQRWAVELAAATSDQMMAWQGVAGAGKTYALNALKDLAQGPGG
jgi:hypothetical protein